MSVVTTILADHLDWHGSLQAYVHAKENMVRFQHPDDFAVLNADDKAAADFASQTPARVILFSAKTAKPFELILPGRHNQSNAQAAFAGAQLLGVSWDSAQQAIGTFAGLPHRLELIHEDAGVRFFNDSIATIPEAAVAALESFPPRRVLQIVGGKDKGLPLTAMCNALVERSKAALCIGATGPIIGEMMASAPHQGAADVYQCGDLTTAVRLAKRIAVAGDVILLSPGFASFDQFQNFEERGDTFARLARS